MNQYILEEFLYTSDYGEDAYLFNSSSSSSEEEDDVECTCQQELELHPVKKSRLDGFVEVDVPILDEYDFKNSFRVNKTTYTKVLEMLYPVFNTDHKGGRERISADKATYMLLWYLGNKETFKQVADRFKNTTSSIHGVIKTATTALSSKLNEQIIWPSKDEYQNISQLFEEVGSLTGCLGVLGISYIKIPKSRDDNEMYICEYNYPCMILQGVVTVNGKFLDIFIGEGSNDPDQLLQKSQLYAEAENNLLGDYYLLGTKNYANQNWLVQAYKDDGSLTLEQTFFNKCHETVANTFTMSIGVLTGRFQRLQNMENRDTLIVTQCIESACMIHNLAIDCEDDSEDFFFADTGTVDLVNEGANEIPGNVKNDRREQALQDLINSQNFEENSI